MNREMYLKQLMEAKSGNVKAFAIDIGLPYSTVRSILERGIMNAKVDNVFKICEGLGIKPDSLVEQNGSLAYDIHEIVISLSEEGQKEVYDFAEKKLDQQNKPKVIELDQKTERSRKKAEKEARELEKEVQDMMNSYRYVAFGGEDAKEMNQETQELMEAAIRHSIIGSREDAKEKFTPKKYRKDKKD